MDLPSTPAGGLVYKTCATGLCGSHSSFAKKRKEVDDRRQTKVGSRQWVGLILGSGCCLCPPIRGHAGAFQTPRFLWPVSFRLSCRITDTESFLGGMCNYCNLQNCNWGGSTSPPSEKFPLTLVFLISCEKRHDLWILLGFRSEKWKEIHY